MPPLGFDRTNTSQILLLPSFVIRTWKCRRKVHLHRNDDRSGGTDVELQPGVRRAADRDDGHDGPVRVTEAAGESLFVGAAGIGRFAGMGVNPNASKLFWSASGIALLVKVVSDSRVVEGNRHRRALLFNELHVFNQQQIVSGRDAEAANLRITVVTEIQQLRPRIRREPERWALS